MEKRIVRLEGDLWQIRTDTGELPESEQNALIAYFNEIKLPHQIADGCLCIAGGVDRESVFKCLENFYDVRAEVLPF
jgi:hypothetical protein